MKLLKFYAKWCKPCEELEAQLQSLNCQYDHVDIETDEGAELCQKYNIRNVPTLIKVQEDTDDYNRLVGTTSIENLKNFIYGV